jgi:hypothetical protein
MFYNLFKAEKFFKKKEAFGKTSQEVTMCKTNNLRTISVKRMDIS